MIARYTIEHTVEFVYSAPVQASVMTLYLRPVQDRRQVVRGFAIETDPSGPVFEFEGPFHNRGHFFDRPGTHRRLSIVGRSTVEVGPIPEMPLQIGEEAWARLGAAASAPELGLMLQPSRFVRSSPLLADFIESCGLERGDDPLATATALIDGEALAGIPIMQHILDTSIAAWQEEERALGGGERTAPARIARPGGVQGPIRVRPSCGTG